MIGCSSGVCKFLMLEEFKSSSDLDYFAAETSPGLRGGSLGAELSFRYFSLGLLEANSFWSPTTTTRSCSSSSLLKFKFFLRLSKSSGWLSIKSSFVRKSSVGFCSLTYRFNSCNIRWSVSKILLLTWVHRALEITLRFCSASAPALSARWCFLDFFSS